MKHRATLALSWLFYVALLVGCAWLWSYSRTIHDSSYDDSPLAPHTPAERAKEAVQLAANAKDERQRAYWVKQVSAGHATFEEAGCAYRGGDWNYSAGECEATPSGHEPLPPAKSPPDPYD